MIAPAPRGRVRWTVVVVVVCAVMATPRPASAYLEPGAGSILLQGFMASIGAIATAVVAFRHAVTGWLSARWRRTKPSE